MQRGSRKHGRWEGRNSHRESGETGQKLKKEDRRSCSAYSAHLIRYTYPPLFLTHYKISFQQRTFSIFREFECFVNIYFIALTKERSNVYHQREGPAGIEIKNNSIAAVVPMIQPPCCPCTCSSCIIPTSTSQVIHKNLPYMILSLLKTHLSANTLWKLNPRSLIQASRK